MLFWFFQALWQEGSIKRYFSIDLRSLKWLIRIILFLFLETWDQISSTKIKIKYEGLVSTVALNIKLKYFKFDDY